MADEREKKTIAVLLFLKICLFLIERISTTGIKEKGKEKGSSVREVR